MMKGYTNGDMSTVAYTQDQLRAIDTIINTRPPYMTADRELCYKGRNVVLSDTTLLVLYNPIWNTGTEFDANRLIHDNEMRDCITVYNVSAVSAERTHYHGKYNYCKVAENAFFDPKVMKRAFRAMKYRDENITLHYTVDQRTQQRYCRYMTFWTKYGYAMVMAVRVRDESNLNGVDTAHTAHIVKR